MFGSLVRGFGVGDKRSARKAGLTVQFTPRLEALDIRANPGGIGGISSDVFTGSYTVVTELRTGDEVATPAESHVAAHGDGVWVGGQTPHGGRVDFFGGKVVGSDF